MSCRSVLSGVYAVVGLFLSLTLIGCGAKLATSGPAATGADLTGLVHGGQQPIAGASLSLYGAGKTGYGTGAVSLLNGSHVTTDSNGAFSIAGNYTCPSPDTQTYLIASGGNTGSGVNSKSVLMAALGSCGNLGSLSHIDLSEVSTVASVYALAQFMTPGSTAIGTSSTNTTGLVNAFNTAVNLVDMSSGVTRATTLAGNGTVPQATINTLANIMAVCVNTTGDIGPCPALFAAATPPGGSVPADTLAAMLDIALNPGNNVTQLYNLALAKGPFQPSLAGSPNDWTLSVEYTGGGLNTGQLIAADGSGNIWVPNATDPGTLSEFSPLGAPLSPSTGITGGGLSYPFAVAADLNGNIWTANEGNASISEHTASGTPLSGPTGFRATGLTYPNAIALDAAGNVFTSNGNNSVTKLNSSGSQVAQFTSGGLDIPYAVAIDVSQNVWIANSGTSNSISKFSDTGTPAATQAYTGGGMSMPVGIAIDASGNAWIANFNNASVSEMNSSGTALSGPGYVTPSDVASIAVDGSNSIWTANADGSISHLSQTGAALSPATGYISPGATADVGIAIDASGNIWTTDNYVDSLFEYIGAASPAVVPLQLAVKNNTIGQRP
jgi:streptogramin lyase